MQVQSFGLLRALCALAVATAVGGSGPPPARATVPSSPSNAGWSLGYPAPPPRLLPGQHAYTSWVRVRTTRGRAQIVRIDYLLYAPAAIRTNRPRTWPLVVFLHGYGERGADPELLTAQPLPRTLARTTSFPAIVLSPQLPLRFGGWSEMIGPVDALVQRLEVRYPVDHRRVYLTGLSTGGFGTWEYGLRHPSRFAALVPIAGGYPGASGAPPGICALRDMPIWAFHGALDTIVPPYQTEALVKALRACGSKVVRLTLYPGVDHFGSWPRAYADPALWRWLFSQRRR
jgi:predicted peptidase